MADSRVEQNHLVRYQDLNGHKRLFGGILMQWIDELAGLVAFRHCGSAVITAAVDNLVFKKPVMLNDWVSMTGAITYVGTTSMEVRVDSCVEQEGGAKQLVNRAYLVMVSLGEDGRPRQVPPLALLTKDERHEWDMGEKRYQLRKRRSKENF